MADPLTVPVIGPVPDHDGVPCAVTSCRRPAAAQCATCGWAFCVNCWHKHTHTLLAVPPNWTGTPLTSQPFNPGRP